MNVITDNTPYRDGNGESLTQLEQEALDIVEASPMITASQLAALTANDALRHEVADHLRCTSALRYVNNPIDVESRLQQFHVRRRTKRRRLTLAFLGAAAVLVSVVFLIGYPVFHARRGAAEALIFATDMQQSGISLSVPNGERVTLSAQGPQNAQLSLADFRNGFDQVADAAEMVLEVPFGKSADLTLPDGSIVALHPGSRLAFPSRFVGSTRMVRLYGQAYFRVAADAQHPFIVLTDQLQTTVLGTEFHVDAERAEVVLVKGSVQVQTDTQTLDLKPAQRASLSHGVLTSADVDTTPYEYWRDGYLYFDDVPLRDIMLAIGQNYNLSVEFVDSNALNQRMRFVTERNAGVEEAIRRLSTLKKANITIRSGRIRVN